MFRSRAGAALVRDLDAWPDSLRSAAIRRRRCICVRTGNARIATRVVGVLSCRTAPEHSHARRQSQPELVQRGGGGGLRSVAAVAVQRIWLTAIERALLWLQRAAHQFFHG